MKRFIFETFFVILLILSETRFGAHKTTNALTDAQRKEIENLRTELDEAFEKDEEETLKAHGVITQPEWTQNPKIPHISKTKVVVTKSGLNEAKALRDEILKAVKQDKYTPIVSSSKFGANSQVIQEFHQTYDGNENNKKSKVGDMLSSRIPSNAPNIIDAFPSNAEPEIDLRKLQRLELNKRRTRELLILESIEEDFSFNLGEHVQEWEHIIHGGQEFFIGRIEQDLQIVHKNALHYEASEIVHIGAPITYLETYTFWNSEQQQQEGIIIVATGNQVRWYRADEKRGRIALYWEWVVGSAISGLTYFRADGMDYLVVSSNQSLRAGYYALNIYQFDLKNKEFWITQRLQLLHPCEEVTLLNTGRDYILAVPQNNTAAIYTFNPHTEASGHVHFQLKTNFDSEGIEYITAFQMGGRSYLALGGMQPQILLYQQGEFIPKTIFGNNFGFVEFFFPIPVRTYRDDLLLLVQHRVDFVTHKLTVLETLIWDGESFEAAIPAPCKLGLNTVYGVNCMLDIQRDAGLKGAALLKRGDEVSVIVPRHKAESGLFRLHTKLLAKNSELKDLQEIFDFLKEWVAEQDALIAQAQRFLREPMNTVPIGEPNFDNLKLLKTPELYFTGALKELYVNDYKWTNEDTSTNLNHVMNEIEKLEHEISLSRHKRSTEESIGHTASFENLDSDDVEAEFLEIENVNGEPFYVKNCALDFDGILNLVELEVLESEHLEEERQAMLEELVLERDIEFEEINDVPWQSIAENLIFTDKVLEFENLEVEGELVIEDQLEINLLNSLRFSDDFLLSEGGPNPIVYASKTYEGLLSAYHVDTNGLINGKNPLDIVTLGDPQEWTGLPTFSNLEVSKVFELNGTARGPGVDGFPHNPTLEDTNVINANCEFVNLRVLGPIKIQNNFNNEPLSDILSDIIQRPEDATEEIRIPSKKTFSNVEFPIDFHIQDNKINNISIDQFIPSQTVQELHLSMIDGYVYFGNLTLTGSYDGVMIDELMKNAIRIDQLQNLSDTQLNFADLVEASSINIVKTLNDVPIATGYQTIEEDLVVPEAFFKSLKTEEGNIAGDIKGAAKLNGIDLSRFLETRVSPEFQENPQNIFVNELVLESGLQVDEVHGFNAQFLDEFLAKVDSLAEMVLDGKIHVDRITVSGNVQVNKLNGQHFDDDIQLMAIWLNRPNYLSTKLQFMKEVDFKNDLNVLGNYNGKNLPDLMEDMVFRNWSDTVLILAPKKFAGYVHVLQNTEVNGINGIPFSDYANRYTPATFDGSLQLNGNILVQELVLNGTLNEFSANELSEQLYYDSNLKAFVLRGVTHFERPFKLNDLTVYGDLNGFKNLKGFFENLVYKAENCILNGQYNFTGRVSIDDGIYIGSLNGHNLLDLFQNIVYINEHEPLFITSPINFSAAVKIPAIQVKGALETSNLNGCVLKTWLNDTLDVENAETLTNLRFAPESLHGNSFFASFLNNIDLSKVITLNTPQNLNATLRFSEVYLDGAINVSGTVNGVDLEAEFENTLLTTGNQLIRTPLTVQTVNVFQNLESKEPINGDKELAKVATLYENLEFDSPLFFTDLRAKDINTDDLISGIDFNEWHKFALWKKGRKEHRISGNWSVESLSLKNGPSMPEFVLGSTREINGLHGFRELCQKYEKLFARHSNRAYALKHISKAFELDLNSYNPVEEIQIQKAFKLSEYLLVNVGCNSVVFKWNIAHQSYELITEFESGIIEQLAVAVDNTTQNVLHKFISNSKNQMNQNCTSIGLNLWKLEKGHLKHLKKFKENVTALWAAGFKGHIFAITDEGVKRISTSAPYDIKHLDLKMPIRTGNYSFTVHDTNSKILYKNSTHFAQISQGIQPTQRPKRGVPHRYSYRSVIHPLTNTDESILKPNATIVQKLTFADFSHIIERILEDLDYRLGIEINITQLSIPESDLFDPHLIQDFIAIIEELRSQQIYPSKMFTDVKLDTIQIPENPAQILAVRAIQIVWPIIVEIDEIHRYLRGNSTTEHPTCACILNHLGLFVKEVMFLADLTNELRYNDTSHKTVLLSAVINRIREFQSDLKALETELKIEIAEDITAEMEHEIQAKGMLVKHFDENKEETSEVMNGSQNYSLQIHKYPKRYSQERSELLNLEVGAESGFNTLMAITFTQPQLTPGRADGINLYVDLFENDLFQFIPAHKPRSMATMRIRDITLLAYVEHCCTVNVLQYRGVEGFVGFAKITSEVPINHLMELSLPHGDFGRRHYFVTVLSHKLVFYEVLFAGLKEVFKTDLLNCN